MAKGGDANGRRDAHGEARTMSRYDFLGAVGGNRKLIDDWSRVFDDELARRALAAVHQVACTIAGQISAPKPVR